MTATCTHVLWLTTGTTYPGQPASCGAPASESRLPARCSEHPRVERRKGLEGQERQERAPYGGLQKPEEHKSQGDGPRCGENTESGGCGMVLMPDGTCAFCGPKGFDSTTLPPADSK